MSSGPAVDFKIGADTKQFRSAIGNIDHSLKKLSGGFGALGGLIGATFAVNAIQEFAAESLDLAAKMQGVETAFNRLNDPNLLDNLRRATGGTVDDLKLMQTAVKAKNFRIPMDALAKGLEFAQRRAQATGESVDYMVDSFVTGMRSLNFNAALSSSISSSIVFVFLASKLACFFMASRSFFEVST